MELTIDHEARTATVSINGTYNADELLGMMSRLAHAKAILGGEIDEASGTPIQLCAGAVDAGPAAGGMRLAIRHPELGWVLTHVPLARLAELLAIGASVLAAELGARGARGSGSAAPIQ